MRVWPTAQDAYLEAPPSSAERITTAAKRVQEMTQGSVFPPVLARIQPKAR